MDFGLKGKNALITGSTKGMGRSIAEILAQEGANVIVTGRSFDEAKEVADKINAAGGGKAVPIACDLSKLGAAEELFDQSVKELGSLDILVNNAGVWPSAYVREMELSAFSDTLYLNLEVPFLLCQKMVNHLIEADRKGKIVNMVSVAGFQGSTTGHAHYASSKAGLKTFTVSLAREVAKNGINVNAVAPGMVETAMTAKALATKRDYYNGRIPIGRVAQPEEVAYPVVYLCSDKADYLTGITLDATGGMLMR